MEAKPDAIPAHADLQLEGIRWRATMKIGKRGSGLAIRIPSSVVKELNLNAGEEMEITVTGEHRFVVSRDRKRLEALDKMRKMRFVLPDDYVFNRDEIYDRQ
jgi:antitoxin MazE